MSQHTQDTTHSVVVVGGGAAGWLTAAIIAAEHNLPNNHQLSVTVVESPEIKILGVGEGTWPTMRDTLRKIGVDELSFLVQCSASFKQGTCFNQWVNGTSDDRYYHPFSLPHGFFEADIAAWWANASTSTAFSDIFCTQSALCEHQKGPKQQQTPDYAAVANYGYHLDASKFADFLKRHCVNKLGITHTIDHVDEVVTDAEGYIESLQGRKSGRIYGDLFVDCTGFAAKLIGQHYQTEVTDVSNCLINDTALAVQAQYINDEVPIASATASSARENGWIWDIGLPQRKGIGYVYGSRFTTEEAARATLLKYIKADQKIAPVNEDSIRKITFSAGYRATPWYKNCVAVGTAAGFLEPLEASALVMVELAATMISLQLPRSRQSMQVTAEHFNKIFAARWQRIIDFLKLHYVLSQREDTEYWRYMRSTDNASDQLKAWLQVWQERPPLASDFIYADEIFPMASYLYVLYGMGFRTRAQSGRYHPQRLQNVEKFIQRNQELKQKHLQGLPTNRDLLNALCQQAPQVAG